MNRLSIKPVAFSLSILISSSFVVCVIYGLIFSKYTMHSAWEAWLPGFVWLNWTSFFIGLAWTILYGFYLALVFVPLYNYFSNRAEHKLREQA